MQNQKSSYEHETNLRSYVTYLSKTNPPTLYSMEFYSRKRVPTANNVFWYFSAKSFRNRAKSIPQTVRENISTFPLYI